MNKVRSSVCISISSYLPESSYTNACKGENLTSYNELFLKAWANFLKEYEGGRIRFLSEGDLQSHLFSECLKLMSIQGFETPFKIHAEKSISGSRRKTDLVLGDDEVAIEIKLEPDYPGMPGTKKPVTFVRKTEGSNSVEHDIERISEYKRLGVKHAHFVMIDEDESHKNKIAKHLQIGNWKILKVNGRKSYCLVISR